MPPKRVLFYVSGHGFGHARRSAQVIASLVRNAPRIEVIVRSAAPARIFTDVGVVESHVQSTAIDAGVVEHDAMTVDAEATIRRVLDLHERREQIVREEVAAARAVGPSLVVTDIPHLAGDVAAALGVACVASGNFTWDWIYGSIFGDHPRRGEVVGQITASYRRMAAVLRHPFSHEMPQFPRVIDVRAVARPPAPGHAEARRRLNLDERDRRPRVLLGMRGGTSTNSLLVGVRDCPHLLFTTMQPPPPDAPPNLCHVSPGALDFSDVLAAHDVVISKLGYGLVCDAMAAGTRLLWPRRVGFPEDALFETAAPRVLTMREIPREDYTAGNWRHSLDALLAAPPAPEQPATDGADVAADALLRFV